MNVHLPYRPRASAQRRALRRANRWALPLLACAAFELAACGEKAAQTGNAGVAFSAGGAPRKATLWQLELEEDERVLGVSSEGDVWLARESAVRSVGADKSERTLPSELAAASWVAPSGASAGLAVVNGTLLSLRGQLLTPIVLPPELGSAHAACGDAEGMNASGPLFVAASTGLWQRELGRWYHWSLPTSGAVESLADLWGVCQGADRRLWLLQEGRVMALDVTPGDARIEQVGIEEATALAIDTTGAAIAARANRLVEYREGTVATVDGLSVERSRWAQAGGALWVYTDDDTLHVRNAGAWTPVVAKGDVNLPNAAEVHGMWADATGALWIEAQQKLTRVAPFAEVWVRGLTPWQPHPPGAIEAQVRAAESLTLRATLDGEELPSLMISDTHVVTFEAQGFGEHVLRIEATGKEGDTVREIPFVITPSGVSWQVHLQPLFEARCASCHASDADPLAPDMDSYDAWRERADLIYTRTSMAQMPPNEPLSSSDVSLIRAWLEGGLEP